MNIKGMLPKDTFSKNVVLITGGGTGLGKSIGKYIIKLGGKVIITSRRSNVIDETALEFNKEYPDSTLAIAGDVRNIDDVENVVKTGIKHFGSINMLINNAAGNFISRTEDLSPNAINKIIDIVLKGSVNTTMNFSKDLIKEERDGTILSISTLYADTGSGFVVPSAIAKSAYILFIFYYFFGFNFFLFVFDFNCPRQSPFNR